jgi:ParB family chromosome partitioning protein
VTGLPLAEILAEDILIDAEFSALCPPLSAEEYATLEASLLAQGCRDALVIWEGHNVLLDGHNRKRICDENGLDFDILWMTLPDRDAAKQWIWRNQLGRRNLHPDAAALMRGRLYNAEKKAPGAPVGNDNRAIQRDQSDPVERTADRLASELGVSAPTIKRDGRFADAVDTLAPYIPDLPRAVMGGEFARKDVIEAAKEPEQAAAKLAHVAHNSGNNEWYTPKEYVDAARSVMGGIDCDPASSDFANATVGAETYYTIETNGLAQEWRGRVWMNPPYAQPYMAQFCETLASQYGKTVTEACVLVNNATETGWFHTLLDIADAVCFLRGRIRFLDAEGRPANAPLQGQAVVYCGPNVVAFEEWFGWFGVVLYANS